jgi:hypothetical protein
MDSVSRPDCVTQKRAVYNCKPGEWSSSAAFRIRINGKRPLDIDEGGFQIGPRELR